MDAIKKKMQAMKLEKDNALDRAAMCEQQAKDANLRAEKAEEEARQLQKKIQTIENDLDQTQEALMQVNAKLEEKEKALQNWACGYSTCFFGTIPEHKMGVVAYHRRGLCPVVGLENVDD
uniref:SFRICE_005139 n=1 Tax=Spodoptera frugiperda TaxID=7108 RepID=A0A2H1V4C7_SPOFR